MEDWGTPDGWWNTVVARAYDARQPEPYVAWRDLQALREENATLRAGLEATAAHRAKVERELDDVRAEVARLEGLILDAYEFARIKPGNPDDVWLALLCEVGRIRAQREGKCPNCEGTGATGAGVPCCNRAQREGDGIDTP